jgi:predicted enzyme related to lactoylglutathione lyase
MNSVVHFEMPYDDRQRMAKFYGSAFGWQTQMLGEEMGNYVLASAKILTNFAPHLVKGPRELGIFFALVSVGHKVVG